jgi:hypothetical protein
LLSISWLLRNFFLANRVDRVILAHVRNPWGGTLMNKPTVVGAAVEARALVVYGYSFSVDREIGP